MTKGRTPESEILSTLKTSRAEFDTSIAALVDLKNAGVSAAVMKAMLELARPEAPTLLRNADVVRMIRSGQSDSAVIDVIRRSKTEFDVTTAGLVSLKREGISDAVIEVVLAATKKP